MIDGLASTLHSPNSQNPIAEPQTTLKKKYSYTRKKNQNNVSFFGRKKKTRKRKNKCNFQGLTGVCQIRRHANFNKQQIGNRKNAGNTTNISKYSDETSTLCS